MSQQVKLAQLQPKADGFVILTDEGYLYNNGTPGIFVGTAAYFHGENAADKAQLFAMQHGYTVIVERCIENADIAHEAALLET